MQYYRDILLQRDPELATTVLMNTVYAKLHKVLVAEKHSQIGVSFPNADRTLGNCLRLHGNAESLISLGVDWLRSLRQYTQIQEIQPVPAKHQHCRVQRVRVKSSPERLLRRSIRNGKLDPAQAEEFLQQTPARQVELPFLEMNSQSTSQKFRLFIQQTQVEQSTQGGVFNSYGISPQNTLPWF